MLGIKSAKLAISKVALLIPCMEFESVMNMPLLDFDHNVSQSLRNPKLVSILGKKWIFSKGRIFILVS